MILTHLIGMRFFPGASEVAVATITLKEDYAYEVYIKQSNGVWEHTRIVFTGTDFGIPT